MTANKQFFKDGLINTTNCSQFNIMSMINTASENLNAKNKSYFLHFSHYEQLKFLCSVEYSMKKVL